MSYWDVLVQAAELLEAKEFAESERLFAAAGEIREQSPGRVFLSEKVRDGWRRVWRGISGKPSDAERTLGRWPAAVSVYQDRFIALAGESLQQAAEVGGPILPGESAGRVEILSAAVYLLTRSRIYPNDLSAAVPLLKAAVAAAVSERRRFSIDLIRHDLPLTEDDRLWLARQGEILLGDMLSGDRAMVDATDRQRWASVLMELIKPSYFGAGDERQQERLWLEARLADRFLGQPETTVRLYRDFLQVYRSPSERNAEARVRLLELLGNVERQVFAVPRYREAWAEADRWEDAGCDDLTRRYVAARQVLAWRRPEVEPGRAWISVAPRKDGTLAFVYWWGSEPRDVAFWRAGDDPQSLQDFLGPCAERLICFDEQVSSAAASGIGEQWIGWPVRPFVEVLHEAYLPREGWSVAAASRLALAESSAWRNGWRPELGHPQLEPPGQAAEDMNLNQSDLGLALATGLLWLSCLTRLREADPSLRDGIRLMARRRDPAAALLIGFQDFTPAGESHAPTYAAGDWVLPPLDLRPDPLSTLHTERQADDIESGPRPDLAGNEVAIVTTGRPAAVLSLWGAQASRWRVVVDGIDRLRQLAAATAGVGGMVTLIPPDGMVHDRDAALALLDRMLENPEERSPGYQAVLPLMHWLRLVESHNGDLLDFQAVRQRVSGAIPVLDLYVESIADLPRMRPEAGGDSPAAWAAQYRERARRSRVVAGCTDQLTLDADGLDSAWGIGQTGDVAWVFLDSAAVHWQLWRRDEGRTLAEQHRMLATRGKRHLSLVLGGTFLREELELQLCRWLQPYGSPYRLALADNRPACLHLAVGGVDPEAHVLILAGIAGQVAHLESLAANEERPLVLLPEGGRLTQFWADLAEGEFDWRDDVAVPEFTTADCLWSVAQQKRDWRRRRLVVPVLTSLSRQADTEPPVDSLSAWRDADRARAEWLAGERLLCSLEVNALLARDVGAVDIADPRWWRRFKPGIAEPERAEPDRRRAAASVAQSSGRPYDLPEMDSGGDIAGGRGRGSGKFRMESQLRAWLRQRDWIDDRGEGPPPGHDRSAPDGRLAGGRGSGVHLHLGVGGDAIWPALCRELCRRLERGELNSWALLVCEKPPAGAAAVAGAYPAGHISVWSPDGPTGHEAAHSSLGERVPGPVLWVKPSVGAHADLEQILNERPPPFAYGGDVRSWLPSRALANRAVAATLRRLTRNLTGQVHLFATSLPVGWEQFLRSFWAERIGENGIVVVGTTADDTGKANRPEPLAVGRLWHAKRACLGCGTLPVEKRGGGPCHVCGLDSDGWRGRAVLGEQENEFLRAKFTALGERKDLGRELPLNVWIKPGQMDSVRAILKELRIPFTLDDTIIDARPTVGSRWIVAESGGEPATFRAGNHAVLFPPPADLAGDAEIWPAAASLWFHADELMTDRAPRPQQVAQRCVSLLREVHERSEAEAGTERGGLLPGELVPLALLQDRVGLDADCLRHGLHVLQWVCTLRGEAGPVDFAREDLPEASRHELHPRLAFAEVEHLCGRMIEAMDVLLPLLLAGTRPGVVTECDLAALPARLPLKTLGWLDHFLLASSLRLSPRGADADAAPAGHGGLSETGELHYCPAAGVWLSSRRRIGYLGSIGEVTARLRHHLGIFLASVRSLMGGAQAAAGGFRIACDSQSGEFQDPEVIELGCRLGIWRWTGPAGMDRMRLADLLQLGVSDTVRDPRQSLRLLRDLAQQDLQWEDHLRRSLSLGLVEKPEWDRAETTAAGRLAVPSHLKGASERVAGQASSGEAGQLVLQGLAGCGRLEALLAGLHAANARGLSWHSVAIFCPDTASAAHFHLAWRRRFPSRQPPLALVGETHWPLVAEGNDEATLLPTGMLTILLEAQRFPAEERYRLSQHSRRGPLIVTVDPGEVEEPWEHLFLVTPRSEEILDLADQLRQARKIWQQTAKLAGDAHQRRGKARRRQKGECLPRWAANLDECLAHVIRQHEAGRLAEPVALIAPLADDLAYLGRTLAARGWLPIYWQELDDLLLPGPFEFLAAVSDQLDSTRPPEKAGPAGQPPEAEADRQAGLAVSRLAGLLDAPLQRAYAAWRRQGQDCAENCLRDFYEKICRTQWASAFLSQPAARHRIERLVADFGDETLARFTQRPLWEVWRREVDEILNRPVASQPGPVVMLATPSHGGGCFVKACVYLCLGGEPRRQHYKVLSRVTDSALVLYQESSPLDGETANEPF